MHVADEIDMDLLVKYIRKRRHELLNDLQVLLGYAQLGKLDKLIEYIHKMIANLNEEREVFNFENPEEIIKSLLKKVQ
ncbi:Spo0B domain-containing protein [Caldanaerobacter sp.]|uniref:Spo0B domain-containing protein n=1 Tax=Caldanaerobacter sp. TaxID=2930036 RepID=UPI003C732A30